MSTFEDEIRDQILEYFYEMYRNRSGTFHGRERGDIAASNISKSSKYDKREISRNLEYLAKSGWIEHVIKYEPARGDPNIKLEKHSYEITKEGIDLIEGESKYMNDKYQGINISNVGGVVVLGDKNIVNQNYKELNNLLNELSEDIRKEDIDDTEKLNVIADIETMQQQIMKPNPDKGILSKAWENIKGIDLNKSLQSAGKILDLVDRVGKFIS